MLTRVELLIECTGYEDEEQADSLLNLLCSVVERSQIGDQSVKNRSGVVAKKVSVVGRWLEVVGTSR